MTILSKKDRESILNSTSFTSDLVEVDEWKEGAKIRVRALTAGQRSTIEAVLAEVQEGKTGSYEKMSRMLFKCAVWCCVDEDGERIFEDKDVKAMEGKDAAPLFRIREKVFDLSGLSAKAAEEAVENFDDAQDDDSSSD